MLITDADRAAKSYVDEAVELQAASEHPATEICRVCSVENNINRIKRWSAIGSCHMCGRYAILFPVRVDSSDD